MKKERNGGAKVSDQWIIYCHTSPDGKKYIGRTSGKLSVRSGATGNRYRQNERFYSDIKRFGWDSFSHEVLDVCDSESKSMELEIYYIKKYDSTNPDNGYNKSVGGYPSNKGLTEEERKDRQRKCSERWIENHREQFLATNRKRESTPEYRAKKNTYNKTEARRKHRTEYMRSYREKNRDEYNRKRRERSARMREKNGDFGRQPSARLQAHDEAEVV